MPRFRLIATCTLAFAANLGAQAAPAADYPNHPIRLIVPTASGSATDFVSRIVGEKLGAAFKQPLIVENLTGAAGIPGTRQMVAAPPDGYTLAIISSNHAINPSLYKDMPYDAIKDVTPISIIGTTPLVVVVAENSPYKTIGDLLASARKQPGKINYGSSGTGSVLHLAGELLKSNARIDMMHIPYKGGNALMTDVMSGQIDTAFLATPSVIAQIQAGKLRALAVSTPQRVAALPDVPTLAESGVKDYAYDAWIAMVGPARLPGPIVEQLQQAIAAAVRIPAVSDALVAQGFVPIGSDTARARQTLADEVTKTERLVQSAGIKTE